MKVLRFSLFLLGITVSLAAPSGAQTWPSRPVRLVVPFAPGGAIDVLGRLVAQSLAETLGQKVYVENVPGAGGLVGVAQIARAEPDGYSFVVTSFSSLAIAPVINPNVEYDPIRDLVHVAYLGGSPNSLVVISSSGIRTLDELIARARRDRIPIAFGSGGYGTLGHLVATYFGQRAGVPMEHVPYKGSSQVVADIAGGHLKLGSISLASALGQIHAGVVVPLAVSARKRIAEFPEVPTFKELGYPELEVTSWFAIAGPAGVPDGIVQRLNREIVKALQRPEMRERLKQEAVEIDPMDPDAVAKFVKSQIARWAPIAKSVLEKR